MLIKLKLGIIVLVTLLGSSTGLYQAAHYANDQVMTESQMTCVREFGIADLLFLAWHEGKIHPKLIENGLKAWELGFRNSSFLHYLQLKDGVEVDATVGVTELMSALNQLPYKYKKVWLAVDAGSWWTDQVKNRAFLEKTVGLLQSYGVHVVIAASAKRWAEKFGESYALKASKEVKLCYWAKQAGEHFDDWVPFGGWTEPWCKTNEGVQYQCGLGLWIQWMPKP
jgi:hypothetical protein